MREMLNIFETIKDSPLAVKIRFIYLCTAVFICASFLKTIYPSIVNSFFENDLLWLIPTITRETAELQGLQLISYFLDPLPAWWGVPTIKLYTFLVFNIFGPLAKHFIFISLLFHFGCSALLFLLARKFGLSLRVSFLSALSYLTMFAHFHVYMWPMAFQHLIVIFFILLVLNFYLKTVRQIENNEKYHFFYSLTLLFNLMASFCRVSILILPAMIIAHILIYSKGGQMRIKSFNLWLPLFLAYLFYPIITFSFGDPRLLRFLYKIQVPVFVKFLTMFGLSISFLFLIRILLAIPLRPSYIKRLKWISPLFLFFIFLILIIMGGAKRLLIPYNFLSPFMGVLAAFIQPLQCVLSSDSARPYHLLPLQFDAFVFMLAMLLIFIFTRQFLIKNKILFLLPVWYIVTLGYIYSRNPLASRIFIYISPIFCIIFCSVFDYLFTNLANSLRLKPMTKEMIVVGILIIAFCFPNMLAIKLALFRGRLINTYTTYDYIRAATEIRQSLLSKLKIRQLDRVGFYLKNVVPVTFIKKGTFFNSDPLNSNLGFVFKQVFNNKSLKIYSDKVDIGQDNFIIYSFNGARIEDHGGNDISKFSRLFGEAQRQLEHKDYATSLDYFISAVRSRPFLINYILGEVDLDGILWVTNGMDLRTWINKIIYLSDADANKEESYRKQYVFSIINKEIDDYIQCLFYISYLKHAVGDSENSKYWLSQLRLLDIDLKGLQLELSQHSLVMKDKAILDFLFSLNVLPHCPKFEVYTNKFKLEKFIFKLFFDI